MSSCSNKTSIQEKKTSKEKSLQKKDGENKSLNASKQKSPSSPAVIKIQLSVSF